MAGLILALWLGAQGPDLQGALKAALELEARGDEPGALRALESLINTAPTWELPRLESARLRLKRGEGLQLAQAHLEAARSLAPENPRAHYLWGLWLDDAKQPKAARAALEIAVALRPQYDEALFRLGALALADGDAPRAVQVYRSYTQRHPEATGARLQLASAYERAGQGADCERELQALARAPATQVVGTARLADFYERTGRAAKAAALRKASGAPVRKLRPLQPSRR